MTAALSGDNNTGTLHYQWKSNGVNVGTDANSYIPVSDDIGNTITVEITSSVETGTLTSAETSAIIV